MTYRLLRLEREQNFNGIIAYKIKKFFQLEASPCCLQNPVEKTGDLWYNHDMNDTVRQHVRREIMKKLIPILLSTLLFTGCVSTNNQANSYRRITMDEAVAMMAQETGYIILDARRPDEFAAGHIPNAINVPNESIGTAEIAELPDKNQLIMVYCRSGRRSKEASEKLVNLGYTNIVEFGGILDWTGETVTGE